jgi:hypothetical protein
MNTLSDLECVPVSLQFGRSLLQSSQRRVIGGAQVVLVAVLMDGAIRPPAAFALTSRGVAIGGEAAPLSDEAERGERSQPVEPLRRVRSERERALARTDQHIGALGPVFDQGRHSRARPHFRWQEAPPWTRGGLSQVHFTGLRHDRGKRSRSQQALHQNFQDAQALLGGALVVACHFQHERGYLLLESGHGPFQASQLLGQSRCFRKLGRAGASAGKRRDLTGCWREGIGKSWGSGGRPRQRTAMLCRQVLHLLLGQAFETGISRMSDELQVGLPHPTFARSSGRFPAGYNSRVEEGES